MSQPASIKWILPFREFILRGFQTLPLTIAGTIGFFATTTATPSFIFLAFVLIFFTPVIICLIHLFIEKVANQVPKYEWGPYIYGLVLGFVFLILTLISQNNGINLIPSDYSTIFSIASNIFIFVGFALTDVDILFNRIKIIEPDSMTLKSDSVGACDIVGSSPVATFPGKIYAPSYWLTFIVTFFTYLFQNALHNYNVTPTSDNQEKLAKRKIQLGLALTSIMTMMLIIIFIRVYITKCDNVFTLITSSIVGYLISNGFYSIAKAGGIDIFGMFENLNSDCSSQGLTCVVQN